MTDPDRLTTTQAAARLGVKRETLYAYVSRGLLTRLEAAPGERGSRFDRGDVETLAAGAPRRRSDHPELVVLTRVSSLANGVLSYRSRPIATLVAHSFENVAELLWTGRLSTGPIAWAPEPELADLVERAAALVPGATAPDRLLLGISALAATDTVRFDLRPEAAIASGRRLIVALLGLRAGEDAAGALARLCGCAAGWVPAVDRAMVLCADHELSTSTLAVRIAASVRTDVAAALSAGLATMSGMLHGSASGQVHRLLELASAEGPEMAVAEQLRRSGSVPGLGHVVYRGRDPRVAPLLERIREVAPDQARLHVVDAVLEVAAGRAATFPNVDYALGALTFTADLHPSAGEAIFATSRLAGWIAHIVEEYGEKPLRFRVRSGR